MTSFAVLDRLLFDYKGNLEVSFDFDDEDENVGYLTDNESGKTFKVVVSEEKD